MMSDKALDYYFMLKSIQYKIYQSKYPFNNYLNSKILFTGKTIPILIKIPSKKNTYLGGNQHLSKIEIYT